VDESGRLPGGPESNASGAVRCQWCGEALPPVHGLRPCSHCGAPAGVPLGESARVDERGMILCDVSCRRCAYNLRGLNRDGLCPECATPVAVSMRGDLLRFSDPVWVGKLARGAHYAFWGVFVGLAAACVGQTIARIGSPIGGIVVVVGGLLSLYGAWLLTDPDPSQNLQPGLLTLRRFVRVALLVDLASDVIEIPVSAAPLALVLPIVWRVLYVVGALLGLAGLFAELMYLEKLAGRIPDQARARDARIVRWGYAAGGLVIPVGALAVWLAPRAAPSGAMVIGGVVALGAGVTLLVFRILYLILLWRLGKLFQAQADLAALLWASAQPSASTPTPSPTRPDSAFSITPSQASDDSTE